MLWCGFNRRNTYVTALPCPNCMLDIIDEQISRVVYFDFQSESGSSLQNAKWRGKTMELANRAGIKMDVFRGNLNWIADWTVHLRELGVFS